METKWAQPGFGRTAGMFLAMVVISGSLAAADGPDAIRKKALALNAITGGEPAKGKIIELLDDTKESKKLVVVAAAMAKEKQQPFNINATYILAKVAHGLKEVEVSQVFYRLNADQALKMQSGKRLSEAYLGLIQLLYDNKKYGESEKVCKEFLELGEDDPENPVTRSKPLVLRDMILSIAKQGQHDKANDMLDRLIKAQPENWLNLELKGRVTRDAGQLEKSSKIYEEVIEKITNDKRISKEDREDFVSDYRYLLSGIYVDLKQIDKAEAHLKALMEKEPDKPTYLNDLGYIWADHDMNIVEAERLIRKALEEDRKQRLKANPGLKEADYKDSAAYLDSLAWVLFKQKKFKEAKVEMLKAVKLEDGANIELYDHLAEIHMGLGEKTEAVAAWKKGIELAGTTKRETDKKAEVEKKLKANQ